MCDRSEDDEDELTPNPYPFEGPFHVAVRVWIQKSFDVESGLGTVEEERACSEKTEKLNISWQHGLTATTGPRRRGPSGVWIIGNRAG